MLQALSYYKFAAHLIGQNKRVLDVGCNEGICTWLFGKQCGYALGVDFDEEAIAAAKANFQDPCVDFKAADVLKTRIEGTWDAVVSFDVIEHIVPSNVSTFMEGILSYLPSSGISIIGTPSEVSQQFASAFAKKGHVNIYSPQRLEEEMNRYFEHVFLFSANDEVVHTGFPNLAHYLIAVGSQPKKEFLHT
jgi:2-polyprenyl-3-methyl-5-hydroxy-6-metoxy-1,4-benzoquinol methylase